VPQVLEYFKAKHKKGYHMVHCWNALKEAHKWRLGYAAYMDIVNNGTTRVTVAIDGVDVAQCASFSSKGPQDAMTKRDEKKHQEKEAFVAIYIDLTEQAIEVQRIDAETKSRVEDNQIMLADLIQEASRNFATRDA
ncbi:hypothetical protein QYE76_000006, partial [Lolium multiflorum]